MKSSRPSKSKRPSKQLLWFWMHDLFKESAGFVAGLDVACGNMGKRRHFRTRHYIGVDLDADRISRGLSVNRDAEGHVSSIEALPESIHGDFVVCLQTIGINSHFQSAHTPLCVNKLVDATNAGGTLVFNIGFDAELYREELAKKLSAAFLHIEQRRYGALSKALPRSLTYPLACAMYYAPCWARSVKTPHTLFVCRKRLAAPTT